MLKFVIFVLAIYVSASFGSDFEKKFTRLINENSDPEQRLYGSTSNSNDGIIINFPQKLDHFNSRNRVKWDQRVLVLNKYYKKPGPFLFYLFGNEEASMDWLRSSQIMSYAKDLNAMVIGLEHRFYGESRPCQNTSLENLEYLNIRQALADIAYIIETAREMPGVPENTKWILFGGFYSGSLAAWARMKYPHLVDGAVASSAPMNFYSEYPEYLENVKKTYQSHNSTCARRIESAFQQLNETVSSEAGRNNATKLFKLCGPLENNEDDIANLQGILVYVVSLTVEDEQSSYLSISNVCDIMNQQSNSPMENLAIVIRRYLYSGHFSCWYGSKKLLTLFQETQYERYDQSVRLWYYQKCTEIGMNLPSTKSVDMFGEYKPDTESLATHCQNIFGSEFNQETIDDGVEETNIEFGALAIKSTSQLVLVYGSEDPWKNAGAPENDEFAQYKLIYIKGGSHRADLMKPFHTNANWSNAIHKISDTLKSWIM